MIRGVLQNGQGCGGISVSGICILYNKILPYMGSRGNKMVGSSCRGKCSKYSIVLGILDTANTIIQKGTFCKLMKYAASRQRCSTTTTFHVLTASLKLNTRFVNRIS
jgi:hypothetical protein